MLIARNCTSLRSTKHPEDEVLEPSADPPIAAGVSALLDDPSIAPRTRGALFLPPNPGYRPFTFTTLNVEYAPPCEISWSILR